MNVRLNYWSGRVSDDRVVDIAGRFNKVLWRMLESPSDMVGDLRSLIRIDSDKLGSGRLERLKEECLAYTNSALRPDMLPIAMFGEKYTKETEDASTKDDDSESGSIYPGPLKLVAISLALSVTVFLVGLVSSPSLPPMHGYSMLHLPVPPCLHFCLYMCTVPNYCIKIQDANILATAIPKITDDLHSPNQVGWIGSA